jgi:hypothetical protein
MDARMSLRDAVLGIRDARLEPVTGEGVPEGLCVGKLTVAQADGFRTITEKPNAQAWLFVQFVRDEEGGSPFSLKDIDAVAKLPADMVGIVVTAGLVFNGMGNDASAEKNSAAIPSEDSASG